MRYPLQRMLPFAVLFVLGITALAQAPPAPGGLKHLLVIGHSADFTHESISHAMVTLGKIGRESGLFDVTLRTDSELLTKGAPPRNARNLDYYDAVFFYTTGELPLDASRKAALLSFIRDDGKGFLGAHSATDTFYKWPEYGEMIGGYFDGHPWNQQVRIQVEDPQFPATRHFSPSFPITDEIYQFREFSRDRVRVLLRLDTASVDMKAKGIKRTDGDFPVAWARHYGKGRVFYCSLGHREAVWDIPEIQKMWLEAIRWAMGLAPGDATPRSSPRQ
jgi:type 1 glutamine amidotransferase